MTDSIWCRLWVAGGGCAATDAQCVGAGAAKGIGLACASCLGHEGAKVVVADLDEEGAKRYTTIMLVAHLTAIEACQAITLVRPVHHIWSQELKA